MQNFLSKLGKTAATAATMASNKASELAEVQRVKGQVSSLKSDLAVVRRDLGERCEQLYADGRIDDETVSYLCDKGNSIKKDIDELEQRIELIKAEYQEKRNHAEGETL